MIKAAFMVIVFFIFNTLGWDFIVDKKWLSPNWASFFEYSLLFIIAILLYAPSLKKDWHRFREEIKSAPSFVLDLVIWSLVGSLLSAGLIYLFSQLLDISLLPQNQENVNSMVARLPKLLSLVMMGLYAPVIEELTFRESFIGWIGKDNTFILALASILSVIVFDMIHVINPPEFCYFLPMALVLTLFYWKYQRNAWASIFLHSFFNTAGFILIAIGIIS